MQITLLGHPDPVPVQAGDTLLASLLRAGIAFPFSCQAGNCGTCALISAVRLMAMASMSASVPVVV